MRTRRLERPNGHQHRASAVHEYRKLDIDIVEAVIRTGLNDILGFPDHVVKYLKNGPAP